VAAVIRLLLVITCLALPCGFYQLDWKMRLAKSNQLAAEIRLQRFHLAGELNETRRLLQEQHDLPRSAALQAEQSRLEEVRRRLRLAEGDRDFEASLRTWARRGVTVESVKCEGLHTMDRAPTFHYLEFKYRPRGTRYALVLSGEPKALVACLAELHQTFGRPVLISEAAGRIGPREKTMTQRVKLIDPE